MNNITHGYHWRDSMRSPMLWIFNGNLIFLFLITILVPSLTFMAISSILIILTITALRIAENKGLSPIRSARAIRTWLIGRTYRVWRSEKNRPAWNPIHDRYSIDHNPLPFECKSLRETK